MARNLLVIRIWLVLMVIAISLTGTSVFAQGATVVRVDPSTLSAQVNDNFNLSVKVDNISNLTAFELHLTFNPAVLEVVSMTNGGFVAADFIVQNTFDNSVGTLDYGVAQMGSPVQGSGTLLTIAFRAKANGNSNLTLRPTQAVQTGLLLSDQNGSEIQASWANGNVNVVTQAPASATPVTPAPASATPITPVPASATPVTPGPASATPITPVPASATPVTPVTPTATRATPATATNTPVTLASATATRTNTPTATPTRVSPTPIPSGAILGTHVVRFGESLYCIGRAYKVTPWSIADANGLWWPYIIFPNQLLLIPNFLWSPIPVGPICQSQFSISTVIYPTATVNPATPTATPKGATAIPATRTPTLTAIPPSGCRAVYYVLPGDTLYHIATLYGTSYSELAIVNQIPNPRLIYSGQRLCIP